MRFGGRFYPPSKNDWIKITTIGGAVQRESRFPGTSITILPAVTDDARGIQEIFHETWLTAYPIVKNLTAEQSHMLWTNTSV